LGKNKEVAMDEQRNEDLGKWDWQNRTGQDLTVTVFCECCWMYRNAL